MIRTAFYGAILITAFVSCATQQNPKNAFNSTVRVVKRLPQGAQCQFIEQLEMMDGAGCANLGRNRVGQERTLRYNLMKKARKRGANIMVLEAPFSQTWEGCPGYGLSMRAKIYSCTYSFDAK